MNFKGSGVRIDDIDLPRIGRQIGVGEDEIHALLEVEASNSGFDKQNRLKMLYEPHLMWRNTQGEQRATLASMGLAYPNQVYNYPKDSYPRLERAMKVNELQALRSCSWGLGQILGSNHAAAGYKTVYDMIEAFCADEANQLQAMINFIVANKLDDNLRAHDWAGVARGYNGPNYAKGNYHRKLATAFAKWQKIRDTPYDPSAPVPTTLPSAKVPLPKAQDTWWNRFWITVGELTKR